MLCKMTVDTSTTLPASIHSPQDQRKTYGPRFYDEGEGEHKCRRWITAEVRYGDGCKNGHNTFAITGSGGPMRGTVRGREDCGGCMHDDIAQHFPELAPLIKWHLTSTDGPMHYPGNVLYFAGDKDCWGLRKDEKRQIRNGKSGLLAWRLVAIDEAGEEIELYKLDKTQDATEQPTTNLRLEWRPWWRIGEGKTRELDHARSAAVWPEATDEELTAPDLEQRLRDRLPALMLDFRAAVESLGFTY